MRRAISTERRLSRAITRTPSNPRECVTRVGIVFQRFQFGESIALRISGDGGALAGTCDEEIWSCGEGVAVYRSRFGWHKGNPGYMAVLLRDGRQETYLSPARPHG